MWRVDLLHERSFEGSHCRSQLYLAASFGLDGVVRELLGAGVEPDLIGGEYEYPLLIATVNSHTNVAQELIKGGAKHDVNSCYNGNQSALHLAAQRGNKEMVQILLNTGANLVQEMTMGGSLYTVILRDRKRGKTWALFKC